MTKEASNAAPLRYEPTGDPAIDRERMIKALAPEVRPYFESVVEDWMGYWRVHPDQTHRYAVDLAAFIGERVLTDFALRDLERTARSGR